MKRKFGEKESEFRKRQKDCISEVTASQIAADARTTSGPPRLGIKVQVLNAFSEKGLIAAKKLFKQLNNVGYPDALFDEWIEEFNFKNVVQEAYRREGIEYARRIFENMNERKFKGKFNKNSFVKWKSEVDKEKGNDGR